MKFADLGLSDELLQSVITAGYDEPTPIQAQAIPSVLMMRDLIGIAQTGTGKTASFVLPMIDILAHGRRRALMPRSLILEPTRELAAQVAENFEKYGKNHDLKMALLIGGVQMGDQVKALSEGVDVLIATPGRLMDLFERGKILLTGCSLLVIDEADRMLDMGFIPDIENICTKLPTNRQTLLFSATMPPPIKKLSDRFLSNPKYIEVARPATANTNIAQHKVMVQPRKKRDVLRHLLRTDDVSTAMIFCNRKTAVRELNQSLRRHGFASSEIHGDMDQPARIAELDRFKAGDVNILVCSDVAARGLDIKGVSHVFNFDTPWHPDDYVHRIGRTGRAGASGRAFTFVTEADAEAIDGVEKLTGMKIPVFTVDVADGEPARPARTRESRDRPRDRHEADAPQSGRRESHRAASGERASGERAATGRASGSRAREEQAEHTRPDQPRSDQPRSQQSRAKRPKDEARGDSRRSADSRNQDHRRPRTPEPADEGWNGPVPGFLNFSVG